MPLKFTGPIAFDAALSELRRKRLVPTELSSADLRQIAAEVRLQALFSARMTQIEALQALMDGLTEMLEGKGNLADAKLKLSEVYRRMGYASELGGFPQDPVGTVPPAPEGSLRDLASEKRMTLTITTNYRMAANLAFVKKGQSDARRFQFPAWELVRIAGRRTPRGYRRTKDGALTPLPGDDWPSRWAAAGGEFFDKGTRMIASKDSPVWQQLGAGAGGYSDTLGNPFPPFAFGSGYGIREVAREEALLLGVIAAEDKIAATPVKLAERLKADGRKIDPKLLKSLTTDLVKREDGSVRLKRLMEDDLEKRRATYGTHASTVRNRVLLVVDLLNMGTRAGALKGWETRRSRRARSVIAKQKAMAREGANALRRVMQGRKDVLAAMNVPNLGIIDFLWGARGAHEPNERGATHAGGWGVYHVSDKRYAAIERLPIVLARGKVYPHENPQKRIVRYGGWSVILKKVSRGRWSVTTSIDAVIKARPAHKPQNKSARLPSRSTGLTTQVRTGWDSPGSTHASLNNASASAGAAKASNVPCLRNRCKLLLSLMQRGEVAA